MESQLLRIRDCAKALAVSERSVWRMLERNDLTAIRVGKSVRVERAQLEQFIARQRKVGSADAA
jgi:excisionase family DNA binding protein